jgi:hypothetical protein
MRAEICPFFSEIFPFFSRRAGKGEEREWMDIL